MLITKEVYDAYDEQRKLYKTIGFFQPGEEQKNIMDIVSDTIKKQDILPLEETMMFYEAFHYALLSVKKLNPKYEKKIIKMNHEKFDDLDENEFETIITYKKGIKNLKGNVKRIEVPANLDAIAPIWLGHEYMHALKDTNVYEYCLKEISSEVIPFFYELLTVNEQFPKIKEDWKRKRLGMLSYDNDYYKEAKKRKNEDPDVYNFIKENYGQYLSSYYYALNLYHLYKKYPEEVLKDVNEVLQHKKTTVQLLYKYDIRKSKENTKIYMLEHENL